MDKSLSMQTLLGGVNKITYHSSGCFLSRVPLPNIITHMKIRSLVFCCCTVRLLDSYQEVNHLLAAKACGFVVNIYIECHAANHQPQLYQILCHCMGSTNVEWSPEVSTYHGPHIGHQVLSQVFLSSFLGKAQALGPQGI